MPNSQTESNAGDPASASSNSIDTSLSDPIYNALNNPSNSNSAPANIQAHNATPVYNSRSILASSAPITKDHKRKNSPSSLHKLTVSTVANRRRSASFKSSTLAPPLPTELDSSKASPFNNHRRSSSLLLSPHLKSHRNSASLSNNNSKFSNMQTLPTIPSPDESPRRHPTPSNSIPLPAAVPSLSTSSTTNTLSQIRESFPNLGITVVSILSWYTFSVSISLYNRWMFSNKNLNFSFPIIITSFHQFILFLLSMGALVIMPKFRLNYEASNYKSLDPLENFDYADLENSNSNSADTDDEFKLENLLNNNKMSYFPSVKEYVTKILPCSLASAGDIGFGNTAFRFISLSLYTMIKTSALIFVLLWGVVFKLERMTFRILTIVLIMTFGVILMVQDQRDDSPKGDTTSSGSVVAPSPNKDLHPSDDNIVNVDAPIGDNGMPSFEYGQIVPEDDDIPADEDITSYTVRMLKRELWKRATEKQSPHLIFLGSVLVLVSACMSGLRWALTQIMLKRNDRTKNPILTMFYLSPSMCVVLLLFGVSVEGFGNFLNSDIWVEKGIGMTCVLILIPGFLAFFMTLSEFVLLQYASLLTLSIAGIFKEILTIFISWLLFNDKLTWINLIGLVITLSDIIWYNMYRFHQASSETKMKSKLTPSNSVARFQFSFEDASSGGGISRSGTPDVTEPVSPTTMVNTNVNTGLLSNGAIGSSDVNGAGDGPGTFVDDIEMTELSLNLSKKNSPLLN